MTPPPVRPVPSLAVVVRILHGALVMGLSLCGAVFAVSRHAQGKPWFAAESGTGLGPAAAAVVLIGLGVTALRAKVLRRNMAQSADEYWKQPAIRTAAIMLWAEIEMGGLIAGVTYLLGGGKVPAAVLVVAVVALALQRPGSLEEPE